MKTNCLSHLWFTLRKAPWVGRTRKTGASPYRETIRSLQAIQLRDYLRTVVLPFHPYYKAKFAELGLAWHSIRTFDDLQRLPFTTKSDLVAGNPNRAFIITPRPEVLARRPSNIVRAVFQGRTRVREQLEAEFRPLLMTSTTGRSNEPIPFVYTGHDLQNLMIAGQRLMELARARQTDRILNMFPFAPHLAFWQAHYAGTQFGAFMLSSGGGKSVGTDGNIRMLRKLNPEVIIGMPTFVYHVLREAVLDGARCDQLRLIVLGGEKVPMGLRAKLRDLALESGAGNEVAVLSTYGFTEAKVAWSECVAPTGEASGFHLYPDLGLVEIVDPETGEPRGDGEPGEIVYTSLDSRGTCVLRYRTGDLIDGGLSYEICPHCSGVMPRLIGRISRKSEVREVQFDKIKGTLVDFNELEHTLDDMPGLGAWQIEICKANDDPLEVDQLVLHVSLLNGGDETEIKEELSRRVAMRTELRPNRIQFHNATEMRRLQGVGELLKEKRVVDRRPKAGEHPGKSLGVAS